MVIMCGYGGMERFIVGEHTTLWIGVVIWILHLGHNNKVVVESIARPHKGSWGSTMAHSASLCGTS
jgi:hypothetical protein